VIDGGRLDASDIWQEIFCVLFWTLKKKKTSVNHSIVGLGIS